jgi:hypothetical protein
VALPLTLVAWVVLSILIGMWSESRGRDGGLLFIAGLLLSPAVALLIVLIQGKDDRPGSDVWSVHAG